MRTTILAIALILFTGLGVHNITTTENKLKLRDVQLKDTHADLKELEIKYDHLNVELENVDKTNQAEKQRLEQEKKQLEEQLQQKERELQAKAEAKRIAAERAQKVAQSITSTKRASAAPAPSGSGCEWLKGRLLANGVASGDIQYATYIAQKESSCNPNAVNRSSGACNVFQEYTCGKWGGRYNVDAHIQGANAYAKNRYGGWAGAYSFWTRSHWW